MLADQPSGHPSLSSVRPQKQFGGGRAFLTGQTVGRLTPSLFPCLRPVALLHVPAWAAQLLLTTLPLFFSDADRSRGSRSNLGLLLLRFPALHTNTHIRVIQFGCPAPKTAKSGGGVLLRPPFLSPFPFVTERGATVTAAQLLLCQVWDSPLSLARGEFAHTATEKSLYASPIRYIFHGTHMW